MSVENSITVVHYQKTAIWKKYIRRDSQVLHIRDYQLVPAVLFFFFFKLVVVTLVENAYKMHADRDNLK